MLPFRIEATKELLTANAAPLLFGEFLVGLGLNRRLGTETRHSLNETRKAFDLIVVKHERQATLFDDAPRYHVIISNRVEATTARWPHDATRFGPAGRWHRNDCSAPLP